MDFGKRTRVQFSQRENFCSIRGHANLDNESNAIKHMEQNGPRGALDI